MRAATILIVLGILAGLVIAMEPSKGSSPAAPKPPGSNREWLSFIAAREKTMTRVTDKAQSMDFQLMRLCSLPKPSQLPEANPHRGHYIHVYVTPGEEQQIRTGQGTYPVGTLIVKEKFPSPFTELKSENKSGLKTGTFKIEPEPKQTTELFTVMLKREAGYNPDCGDWEFMVVSGNAQQVLARGKLDSCIACHKDYKETDYVTQKYPLPKKE